MSEKPLVCIADFIADDLSVENRILGDIHWQQKVPPVLERSDRRGHFQRRENAR